MLEYFLSAAETNLCRSLNLGDFNSGHTVHLSQKK